MDEGNFHIIGTVFNGRVNGRNMSTEYEMGIYGMFFLVGNGL